MTLKLFSRQITYLSTMSKELAFLSLKNWSGSLPSFGGDIKMPPSKAETTFSPAFVHRFMACMLLNLQLPWFSSVVCREWMLLGLGWEERHIYCWLETQVSDIFTGKEWVFNVSFIRSDLLQWNMHILELGILSIPLDGREAGWLLAVTPLPCQVGTQKFASTHLGQGGGGHCKSEV